LGGPGARCPISFCFPPSPPPPPGFFINSMPYGADPYKPPKQPQFLCCFYIEFFFTGGKYWTVFAGSSDRLSNPFPGKRSGRQQATNPCNRAEFSAFSHPFHDTVARFSLSFRENILGARYLRACPPPAFLTKPKPGFGAFGIGTPDPYRPPPRPPGSFFFSKTSFLDPRRGRGNVGPPFIVAFARLGQAFWFPSSYPPILVVPRAPRPFL